MGRFLEKPDEATARGYTDSGQYLWNSGMSMLRAQASPNEQAQHEQDILQACQAALAVGIQEQDFTQVGVAEFAVCQTCRLTTR